MIHLLLAALLFSGFDYAGYNLTRHDPASLQAYRVAQLGAQAAITYWLIEEDGWIAGLKFNLLWWSFSLDWLYYGWASLLNPGHGWESRGAPRSRLISWAWWTPLGLLQGGRSGGPLPADALAFQSFCGISIAFTL